MVENGRKAGQIRWQTASFEPVAVIPGVRPGRIERLIRLMHDSMAVNAAYSSEDPGAGLALTSNPSRFRLLAGDTGLFSTLAFRDKGVAEKPIYSGIFNDRMNTAMGFVYKNAAAQMLRSSGRSLFFHTIPHSGGKKHYSTDFIISDSDGISPVEMRMSGYRAHASLDAFCRKFRGRIRNRCIISARDLREEDGIIFIPVYMTMFL